MPGRINARLSPALERRVEAVQEKTGKSLTAVVTESLERYCDEALAEPADLRERLRRSGFVGGASGPADLSTSYKRSLSRSLRRKT